MSAGRAAELDRRYVWHPFTPMRDWCAADYEPVVLVGGEGALLRDSKGREYVDGNSSIWTNIHGHGHPAIVGAIAEQAGKLAHGSFLGTTNEPAAELAEALVGLFPAGTLERVFYSDDGSTAVECAAKMAVQFRQLRGEQGRERFVVFDGAYHGDTAGAASLGGIATFHGRFAGFGYDVERLAGVEGLKDVDASAVAAVVLEPLVQGAAGMRLWPEGMLREVRAWCDATGVQLILDEVMTGFGRTGSMFACGREAVVPDYIALAKGLTGGTVPLAATLTTAEVFEAFLGAPEEGKTFYYGHSYCGNAVGCAAALASLRVFEEERVLEKLEGRIAVMGELLAGLAERCGFVRQVRQCGFIAGVELEAGAAGELRGARVCEVARGHGLLTRPVVDTVVLMPPLCTTEGQLEKAVGAIENAIGEVLG
ncbi:MAG: adenosylmethionine--8-amino-7-oxononanoate transaminase [Verrucomicrobiales bacterium]|nr:adenosylmethionine--8-amino-7-oxononanoate transaminase [Verrucomicrobiales bacterium]